MSEPRLGVCLLPELDWARDAERWEQAEAAGFHSAWTYDHLSWRQLRDNAWYGAVPTLAAAAQRTRTIRLGTLVASPNFREPVLFAKDVMTLDAVSDGRLDLGLGAGGTGPDATALGRPAPDPRTRQDRFEAFVTTLHTLLTQPATTSVDAFYAATDVRMIPGCVQRPRVPFTIAAAGPRGLRFAGERADAWVTYGPAGSDPEETTHPQRWWSAVLTQRDRMTAAAAAAGRDPASIGRVLLVGLELAWPQASPAAWDEFVARAAREAFTDVVIHWPRAGSPYDDELPGPPAATWTHLLERLAG